MNPLITQPRKLKDKKQRITFFFSQNLIEKYKDYCYENDARMSAKLESIIESFLVEEGEI
jgi:hypothetical protein